MGQPTIICNVANTQQPAVKDYGTYWEATVQTESGYKWIFANVTPTDTQEVRLNGTKTILTINIPTENSGTYTVTGQTFQTKIIFDWQLEHALLKSIENASFSSFGCTIQAEDGYKIISAKIENTWDYNTADFTVQEGGKTATIENFSSDDTGDLTITGETATDIPVTPLTITANLTNCTGDVPETINKGETLNVTLTADEGCKFKSAPQITYWRDSYIKTSQFTVSQETTASVSFDTTVCDDGRDITITGAAERDAIPTGSGYGTIGVYIVTMEQVSEFSAQRFFRDKEIGTDGTPQYENIDLGDYVNRIFRLHTDIQGISEDYIRCGNYITTIKAVTPAEDVITLDFGTVTLPAHNDNITDYKSVYKIMMPFAGFKDISKEYAGRTIGLKYIINVVTGGAVALLSCDEIPFMFEELEPKTNIIFKTNKYYDSDTAGSDKWNEKRFFGLRPFILCEWYESEDYGRNTDHKRVMIGECDGFNKFDEIDPINSEIMTYTEQQAIYSMLQQGIYIDKA